MLAPRLIAACIYPSHQHQQPEPCVVQTAPCEAASAAAAPATPTTEAPLSRQKRTQAAVDVDLAKLVFDHADVPASAVFEDIIQQRRLAGAEKPGKDCGRRGAAA
jgi:hypothetical protein